LYIDYGENYLNDESQEEAIAENSFEAVIFAEQFIRALWEENEPLPKCSSVDGIPIVDNPVNAECKSCPESVVGSGCKPKIRLWLLMKNGEGIKPFVIALSPTSIKHWNNHKRKMKRSKLPVVAVNTVFSLEDIKKNSYRWDEVNFDISGIAVKDMLFLAKKYRDELNRLMNFVTEKDYEDPGDKVDF